MSTLEDMTPEQRDALALRALFRHPEVGPKAKRLYKQVVPDAKFPEIEIEDRQIADRAASDKRIGELEDKLQMQEIERRRERNHESIRAAGLDPIAVEKVMTEEKIGSYDTAIKYVQAQNKNSRPTPGNSPSTTELPADWKEISKNPKQWANREAYKAVDELIAKRQG